MRFKTLLNKFPKLKIFIISLLNLFLDYRQVWVGNMVRWPSYFYNLTTSKIIVKPGFFGFIGGAANPGVIKNNQQYIMLTKGIVTPWYKATGKLAENYLKGSPIILKSKSAAFEDLSAKIVEMYDFPTDRDFAVEDFRLFRWDSKLVANHTLILQKEGEEKITQSLVRSALSYLQEDHLKFIGIPSLDFNLRDHEKNWLYLYHNNSLFLFYSVNPFVVLKLVDENHLNFETILNEQMPPKLQNPGGFGTLVSLSCNPIDYDDHYFLLIVHQIDYQFTGRCYFHWAVLVNKHTLKPDKITSEPIFSGFGARGRKPGIRYISSVAKEDDEIFFYAGEGDIYSTVAKKKVSELERLFVYLHQ